LDKQQFLLLVSLIMCCFQQVQKQVLAFNKKLNNPLAVSELESTIMQTVAKKIAGK